MSNCMLSIASNSGGGAIGIDTSVLLATNPPCPYVATQDCWVCINSTMCGGISVDGGVIGWCGSHGSYPARGNVEVLLKKGQSITCTREDFTYGYGDTHMYGLKK